MSDDSWKGEHLIRGITVSPEERHRRNASAGNAAYHAKRRAMGIPLPAARKHAKFAKSVFIDIKRGERE